ncbi:hypothetical protein [Heliorestis convoluta]|uniref:D-glucuronyl C5-epimerase C-terminal domain-containing protein n=1 Tax=Heliorestis convoluta TaxID=356322 RepID=A0A5Q2NB13_9FIRM|nr:hypothetical protein [Heliorestis convoluta]QGG49440.1 hypothetical protein FTV88_3375 [Heliorestis convoluta]
MKNRKLLHLLWLTIFFFISFALSFMALEKFYGEESKSTLLHFQQPTEGSSFSLHLTSTNFILESKEKPLSSDLTASKAKPITIESQFFEVYQQQGRQKVLFGELLVDIGFLEPTLDSYYFLRYKPLQTLEEPLSLSLTIDSSFDEVSLRYLTYDGDLTVETSAWSTAVLLNDQEVLPRQSLFLDGHDFSAYLSLVYVYEPLGLGVRKERYDLLPPATYLDQGESKVITFHLPHQAGLEVEHWSLLGQKDLFLWDDEAQNALRSTANLDRLRAWTREGVQAITPPTYEPYDCRGFWVVPAHHVGNKLLLEGQDRFAKNMALLSLDGALKTQLPEGIWPTAPRSTWLYDSYGIEAGFFDSRFNSDAALFLLHGYRHYGKRDFLEGALRYADFLGQYARYHHRLTERGGYLVYDYFDYRNGHSEGRTISELSKCDRNQDRLDDWPYQPTVTSVSLNQLVTAMNFLYEIYEEEPNNSFLETAEIIRLAIQDIASSWPQEKVKVDPTSMMDPYYGLFEHPLLTLHDLRYSQSLLERREGQKDEAFQFLIEAAENYLEQIGLPSYS